MKQQTKRIVTRLSSYVENVGFEKQVRYNECRWFVLYMRAKRRKRKEKKKCVRREMVRRNVRRRRRKREKEAGCRSVKKNENWFEMMAWQGLLQVNAGLLFIDLVSKSLSRCW